jgi:hypothetical protein
MQNSPGVPLAALDLAVALAAGTILSVLAARGGTAALNELQIGAAAWALALGISGIQGIVTVMVEGRRLVLGTTAPRNSKLLSAATAALSVLLFVLAGLTGVAIISGQSTLVIGSVAGAGCLVLGLLLLFYKEACIGHESHLEPRQDGIPW